MSQQNQTRYLALILILLHFAIAIPLAYSLNIWADEASTLYTTQHGLMNAIHHATADEKQAPLYFWILSLWRLLNGSIFFARLFSIVCSGFAIFLFASLARKLFEQRAAVIATTFFALHPVLFWASLEIRLYSFAILLSVILIELFRRNFFEHERPPTLLHKCGFLISAVIALYTSYFCGFLLVGLFAVLLLLRKWACARDYLIVMFVAGLLFLPLFYFSLSTIAETTGGYNEPVSIVEGLRIVWNHFLTFVAPAEIFPGDHASPFAIVRLWIVRLGIVAALIAGYRSRRRLTDKTVIFATVSAVMTLFFLVMYFAVGTEFVQIRHVAVLFVPVILFVASFLIDLFSESREKVMKLAAFGVGILTLVSFSYSLLTLYPQCVKRGDWANIATYIEQNERAGQPIIIFVTYGALSLPYYYKGVNEILPNEKYFDFRSEAAFGHPESLKTEIDFVISEIPPEANEIWLAENAQCLKTEACGPLEKFVDSNYTVIDEKQFYLERLRLLRKKAQ